MLNISTSDLIAEDLKPEKQFLNVTAADVVTDPFPHVISEQILDPDLFARLRADYPTAQNFEDQKSETGLKGSRTGQGFDIYRGDASYDQLVARSDAWAEFDAWINSPAFVAAFLDVFGAHLDDIGCRAGILQEKYDRGLIEGRDGMSARPTLRDRFNTMTRGLRSKNPIGEVDLFTRLDMHKALKGYNKAVHCDRPNRLCSLVLYFVDAEKEGIEGGTLTIHRHARKKAPGDYERHPKPEDVEAVATLVPKENMGIWFPCCNNSYHAVNAMASNGKERDYLYISISGRTETFW